MRILLGLFLAQDSISRPYSAADWLKTRVRIAVKRSAERAHGRMPSGPVFTSLLRHPVALHTLDTILAEAATVYC